jgi:hypothetical protein
MVNGKPSKSLIRVYSDRRTVAAACLLAGPLEGRGDRMMTRRHCHELNGRSNLRPFSIEPKAMRSTEWYLDLVRGGLVTSEWIRVGYV